MAKVWDCVVVGGGPAGFTAAIYAIRANLTTLCIAGEKIGGQLTLTTDVEDYPGFPNGVQGPELMHLFQQQAERLGVEVLAENVTKVNFKKTPFELTAGDKKFLAKTVILATGASPKFLGIESEQKFVGRGVSTCAVCDGTFFKNKDIIVVGGGDTAMRETIYLAKICKSVTVVHRRDKFKAQAILQNRVKALKNVKIIWNSEITEFLGDKKITAVKVKNSKTSKESEMKIGGVFVAIGHKPTTDFLKGQIELDEKGYIALKTETQTSVPGVFAAGDVHDFRYMQAVTAAGAGCKAALDAHKFLEES